MAYTIEEHKHITASWAAATGARASKLCRFPVSVGKQILEEAGFTKDFKVEDLPLPFQFDKKHAQWRKNIIKIAKQKHFPFTHGIAAKLINSYFKVRFLCGGSHKNERVKYLHPPIDAVLLDALANANYGGNDEKWRKFHKRRWSKFDSKTYQKVIDLIKTSLPPGDPLWKIEKYWRGYQ